MSRGIVTQRVLLNVQASTVKSPGSIPDAVSTERRATTIQAQSHEVSAMSFPIHTILVRHPCTLLQIREPRCSLVRNVLLKRASCYDVWMNISSFAEAYVNGIPVGLGDVALLSAANRGAHWNVLLRQLPKFAFLTLSFPFCLRVGIQWLEAPFSCDVGIVIPDQTTSVHELKPRFCAQRSIPSDDHR